MKLKFFLTILIFLFIGCEEQNEILSAADCALLTSNFTSAGLDYNPEDSNATASQCQAVNDALLALWDAECETSLTQPLESLTEDQIQILRDGSSCEALHPGTN